jgi:DNA-binding transcriptional LysR family regulator
VWSWLPTFRVVAETEQVHAAARRLHVSPSAISRTVKMLESELGGALFERRKRGMRLTPLGSDLLVATRLAMRTVDDALDEQPRLRVSSAGRLTIAFISPALARVRRAYRGLVATIVSAPAAEIESQLLHGALDVAVVVHPFIHPELLAVLLGEATSGIYCGPGHPLFRAKKPRLDDIVAHPFAGPSAERGRPSVDGWPPQIPRTIQLHSSILDGALESCACGELLAVLPDHVVASLPRGDELRRLSCEIIEPMKVFAIVRRPTGERPRIAERFVQELQVELGRRGKR